MPRSTREALEEALVNDPDDLAAFSAYADYLMEQGDPRGEFTQVQLALENPALSAAERRRLRARERKLLARHERDWLGALAPLLEPPCERRWERGRLAGLHVGGRFGVEFARGLVKCSAELRLLRELHIDKTQYAGNDAYEPGPDVPAEVAGGDHAACLFVLSKAKWLAGVRVLRIGPWSDESYTDYAPGSIHCPGEEAHLVVRKAPRLEELYLMAYQVDTEDVFTRPLSRLRVLQVYHADNYPLERLARNRALANLTHLLCHPKAFMHYHTQPLIRLPGVRALLRSPHLTKLAHLRLRLSDMGDDGCREIVASGALRRLKTLDLRHGCITDEGARALASCPDLKNLEALDVSWNRLTPAGVRALRATRVKVEARSQYGPSDDPNLYLYQGDIE